MIGYAPCPGGRRSGHRWLRDNPLAPGPPVRRGDGLGKVLHPGPTYEHSSAKIETKAECIAHATKPSSLLKAIEFHDGITRICGNTAIYRGEG